MACKLGVRVPPAVLQLCLKGPPAEATAALASLGLHEETGCTFHKGRGMKLRSLTHGGQGDPYVRMLTAFGELQSSASYRVTNSFAVVKHK